MSSQRESWKARICAEVDALRHDLIGVSHAVHADPEVAFQEYRSSQRLADTLEQAGFDLERGVGGLPTAFRAELRGEQPGPTIAILAEYDALPDVGHGCGHNIIATSALGAGLALARTAENFEGRVLVIGTPAEEGGGGKILLAEAGVFEGVDAAMMMHPSTRTIVLRGSLASSRVEITFHGKAAHAAGSPDKGINALESMIQTFVGINGWRLHMRPDARVHGIITHGGDAVNIIPSRASAQFSVRAKDRAYQRELVGMVRQTAEGAAMLTGARLEWTESRGYDSMVPNPTIADLCTQNMRALGLEVVLPAPDERMGSTDMGDISQIMPAIHAYFSIGPETIAGHSIEFADAAVSEAGDAAVINASKSLAMTAADLLSEPALLERAKVEYQEMLARGQVAGWSGWLANGRAYASGGRSRGE
jgi:amidohydrolase